MPEICQRDRGHVWSELVTCFDAVFDNNTTLCGIPTNIGITRSIPTATPLMVINDRVGIWLR